MPSQLQVDIQRIDSIESDFFRDMTWLVYSGNINSSSIPGHYYFNLPEQDNIQATWEWYKSIKNTVIKRPSNNLILGKYSEATFLTYFLNHPNINWVKNNIQLIEGKQTVGEIDYLLQKNDELPTHLEIAIKYYLKTTLNGKHLYLGPNTNDWFQRKIDKLINNQLQLTKRYNSLLPPEFQTSTFSPKLMIKGSLFHPFHKSKKELYSPTYGWWLDISDVKELEEPLFTYAVILKKRNWIFPYNSRIDRCSFPNLHVTASQLLAERNEIMVTRFNAEGLAIDRGFIVRKEWPN